MPGEFLQSDHRHHQDRREDCPDRHHHAVADEIQRIQDIEPFVFLDECQRMHVREDAVAKHRYRTDDRDFQQTVEQRRPARQPHFLADRMDIGFQQGYGRSRRGEQDQNEEHRAEETSRRKTGEHLRHGHENQSDASVFRRFFPAERHHRRNDHHSRQKRDARIEQFDLVHIRHQVVAPFHVNAVGDHDTHGDGEREEQLSHGRHYRHIAEFGDVRHQIIFESGARIRQEYAVDADPQDQDHQHRHQHLVEPFDALLDAAGDHDPGQDDEDQQKKQRLLPRGDEILEISRRSGHGFAADDSRRILMERGRRIAGLRKNVFGDPAPDHKVIRHNDHRHDRIDPAADADRMQEGFLPRAEFPERADRSPPGHPPDADLGDQQRIAEREDQDQISDQENAPAVFRGEVGEPPDIAQSDCGSRRRQHKTQFIRKTFPSLSQFHDIARSHLFANPIIPDINNTFCRKVNGKTPFYLIFFGMVSVGSGNASAVADSTDLTDSGKPDPMAIDSTTAVIRAQLPIRRKKDSARSR